MNYIRTATFAVYLFLTTANAYGAFVDGVESFAGTTKDLATWAEHNPKVITQNNSLIFDHQNMFGTAGYNTRTQTVAWGQKVRATVTATIANAGISLLLTNNSAGPNQLGSGNSAFWTFGLNVNENDAFNRVVIGTGSNGVSGDGNRGIFDFEPELNHTYVMQIKPLSLRSAEFTLFDTDGTSVLESRLYDNAPIEVPNHTHISIVSPGGSSIVHSVATIPEPGTALLVGSMVFAFVGRRQ